MNIFNCDESALYIKGMGKYSHTFGETNVPQKNPEKMPILLGCSMKGEKLPIFFIGKSKNSRCFKKYDLKKEKIPYGANKVAWITSDPFRDWLVIIYNQVKSQRKKIMLILDNATSHKDPNLLKVKLIFLPPNTSVLIQPFDMGIIKAVKDAYIRELTNHIIANFDENMNCLMKEISIYTAICWFTKIWKEINEETVINCWGKSGSFKKELDDNNINDFCENLDFEDKIISEENTKFMVPLKEMRFNTPYEPETQLESEKILKIQKIC